MWEESPCSQNTGTDSIKIREVDLGLEYNLNPQQVGKSWVSCCKKKQTSAGPSAGCSTSIVDRCETQEALSQPEKVKVSKLHWSNVSCFVVQNLYHCGFFWPIIPPNFKINYWTKVATYPQKKPKQRIINCKSVTNPSCAEQQYG